MERAEEVLSFWLDEVGPKRWYVEDPALDAACRDRFGELVEEARTGRLRRWILDPRRALALLILLDQLPRNIFRGDRRAFATDPMAGALAKRAINTGHDLKIEEPGRQFFYLPLMHQENLMDQDRCVRLMLVRMPETGPENLRHAIAHRQVIRRFGRFPFRNEALGRASTREEKAWLAEGGYEREVDAVTVGA